MYTSVYVCCTPRILYLTPRIYVNLRYTTSIFALHITRPTCIGFCMHKTVSVNWAGTSLYAL